MARKIAFTWPGMLLRFLFALLLVFGTYNPKYSYISWAIGHDGVRPQMALIALVGVVLLIAWAMYIHATVSSLGWPGVSLAVIFFAVLTWVVVSQGWIDLKNPTTVVWVVEFILACVLTIGMSWSIIWRKMSGQLDVVDHDN